MILGEVCIETSNVRRLADFYRLVLDISEESQDEIHQFITTEGTALTVYNDGRPKNNSNQNISLAFTVEDIDAEYQRLLQNGVTVIDPPRLQPWGAKNMHFCDPDGNHLYFRSFPE